MTGGDCFDLLVANAPAVGDPRTESLHHHIALFCKGYKDLLPFGTFQGEADLRLVLFDDVGKGTFRLITGVL